ncbi:coiled-coil domain-containing protein 87-like [Amphiura filiformis]|uniref:coiled-coil domain-containing protein 87-like n=1 Tax=Amphiura filiformis TaxID=82378 RepID=UPI003B220BDE
MTSMKTELRRGPEANHPQDKHGMYVMNKMKFGKNDLQKKYEDILGPLTLFAPYFHEEVPDKIDMEVERPVTPIDESIKTPPVTFSELAKLIRRRIAANPDIKHITVDDQQTLAGVIMGEVNCLWPDMKRQVDDPFLTVVENKELQRRITVHIVTVCQQLFQHFVEKAQLLNQRGVFSGPANMSRLKAQLSIDGNKFLNVLAIRRHIVADIRGDLSESEEDFPMDLADTVQSGFVPLSYQKLIETSRPKRKKRYRQNVELEVRDMNRQMPHPIQPNRVLDLLPDVQMMQRGLFRDDEPPEVAPSIVESKGDTYDSVRLARKLEEDERPRFRIHRSDSLPELHVETLLEEMGIEGTPDRPLSSFQVRSITDRKQPEVQTARTATKTPGKRVHIKEDGKAPDNRDYLKEDLQKLSSFRSGKADMEEPLAEEEDLPPLLQAVGETTRADARRDELKKHLKEMEEKKALIEAEETIQITEPTHPQPATITKRLPNKSVVRTSDIRVSERVSMSSVTLKLNQTVFNELTDEVDAHTIKRMDSNLFRGQEINEVYNEILKTLPTGHMDFDVDTFVEPPAAAYALKQINPMASALHAKKGTEFVLNKSLRKTDDAPWGESREEWCKSPIFTATFAKNRGGQMLANESQSLTSNLVNLNFGMSSGLMGLDTPQMRPPGGLMDERNARSYQSWLNWWKSTVSSEDYTKYLFTQESDYLNAVFHMYNAENEEGDERKKDKNALSESKLAKQREKEQQLGELRAQKSEFTAGMWNVNSVLLGGLGRDPDLPVSESDEEEDMSLRESPSYLRRTRSAMKSSASRASDKASPTRTSRNQLLPPGPGSAAKRAPGSAGKRSPSRAESRASSAKSRLGTAEPSPQDRLEKVWYALQMPDGLKLDMAIKYSSDEYMNRLEESIGAWEEASDVILHRESILARLEEFERFASDPDRFFRKGQKGSSVNRLEEAKTRSQFYASLHEVDAKVRRKVQLVWKKFNDSITYQGRPYHDKMKVDCTEMLYWLQQERRQQALERHSLTEGIKIPVAELPPIHSVPVPF